jgi:MFS family permease
VADTGARGTVLALRIALDNVEIRRVEVAWGLAIAAEWGHFVALGVFAYGHGGASAVGIAGLVRLLPAAFVAPVAANLGDRVRRERFLTAVTVMGVLALVGSAAAAAADAAGFVYAFAAIVGLWSTLMRPTLQALLPSLARTPAELVAANATTSTIESVATLVGPLVAGLLVSITTGWIAFAFWAGPAALAAVVLARVRSEREAPASEPSDEADGDAKLTTGVAALARIPAARLLVGLIAAQTFVRGCLNVLIVVASFRLLGTGAGAVGYLTAAIGFGGLLGALRAMTLDHRRLAGWFSLSLVCWGLPISLIAVRPDFGIAFALLAIVGAANSIEDVAGFTLLQRTIPDAVLVRTLGLTWGLAMGGVALGSLVAPHLVDLLQPRSALLLVGAILPLLTLCTYRRLARLDATGPRAELLQVLELAPMLAPLSIAAKERLAARLTPVAVPAGEPVIRAGEVGDRFYILARGTLEIAVDDAARELRAPDSFGEIALLRDTPRTATVTAVTDAELYALGRDDFLAAVTGHSAAHAAGRQVVEERLARPAT